MVKEIFNRNVEHKNIGEISIRNNIGGTTKEFWNQVANNIENNAKDCYTDYRKIDAIPEEKRIM